MALMRNYRLTKFVENKIGGIDMAYNKAEKSDAPMRKRVESAEEKRFAYSVARIM